MQVNPLHPWTLSPQEAVQLQQRLRAQVSLSDTVELADITLVAGVDNAYTGRGADTVAHAAVVVLDFPDLKVVETQYASVPISFPYVPGLLSFREAPAMLAACALVEAEPDVVLFDAQGIAHPRRLGAASHLGLFLGRPSIGCAKSRLVGTYEEPSREQGAWQPLIHKGETVGAVVRTRPTHAPLFVSPGHMVSVERAVNIALACCRNGAFLPEPTRLAHNLVTEYAREQRKEPGQIG